MTQVPDRIEVACAVEGDYAHHCAAMLHSVLARRDGMPVRVHYLHGPEHVSDVFEPLARMVTSENGCTIEFHEVDDERCAGLPTQGFTGKATWYRIFLPELLPDIDRVLCLDVDLIAVDAVSALWETDLDGVFLAAVTNVLPPRYLGRPAAVGIDPHAYFNAGVMLLNLALMRDEDRTTAIRDFAVENAPELVLRDQDALNFALAARRRALHPRWNVMNALTAYRWARYVFSREQIEEARTNPAIRHFEGPGLNKPWHYRSDREAQELYRRHREQTPWPDYRLAGRTPASVARRQAGRLRSKLRP